ncbi:hypothetical protein LSUE1_G006241, partial [Lachnellula suecica]
RWRTNLRRGSEGTKTDMQRSTTTPIIPRTSRTIITDKNPRPAKRRKLCAALTVTSIIFQGHTPELHVGQLGPFVALSTATPEIDDAQP